MVMVSGALTWWGDRSAAWSGQRWTGDHAACRLWGHIGHGTHGVAGALVVHGHTVREGVTHGVVGLTVMATNLLRLPADILRTEHEQMYYCT